MEMMMWLAEEVYMTEALDAEALAEAMASEEWDLIVPLFYLAVRGRWGAHR